MREKLSDSILVAGVPRSGTTWTARALNEAPGTSLLHEPDNEKINVLALRWKHGYHRMPYLRESAVEPAYADFWRLILNHDILPSTTVLNKSLLRGFNLNPARMEDYVREKCRQTGGANRYPDRVTPAHQTASVMSKASLFHFRSRSSRKIVKSVHAGLALSFLFKQFEPRIVLVFRHPASVVSSYLRLGLYDANREVFRQIALAEDFLQPYMDEIERIEDPLALMGLQVSIFYYVWEQQLKTHPQWLAVTHESLCENPESRFRDIFENLELEWTEKAADFLMTHDTEGSGFEIRRKSSDEIGKWRKELTSDAVDSIRRGYGILPLDHYHDFAGSMVN